MQLPQVTSPQYDIVLPLSKKSVKYRPFLGKEEKILLMAIEDFNNDKKDASKNSVKNLVEAVSNIIQNCVLTSGLNIKQLPIADVELLFINIRKKSIGEIIDIIVEHNDGDCHHRNKVQVNLEDVILSKQVGDENKIEISPTAGLILKYPTMQTSLNASGSKNNTEAFFNLIIDSVDQIYNGDDFSSGSDYPKEELAKWLETLPPSILHKIYNFFNDLPSLKCDVKYKCQKCGKDEIMEVKDTASFFT